MQRKYLSIICIMMITTLTLTGCGNQIPEMSADQNEMVTQYAADLLLGTKSSNTRLIDTAAETARRREIAKKAAAVQAKIDQEKATKEKAKEEAESKLESTPVVDNTGGTAASETQTASSVGDISAFLGLTGLEITYNGCELSNSYTDESTEDTQWAPSIDATSGSQLLIVKLGVKNSTEQDISADVVNQNASFQLIANDSQGGSILMTMLLSDFSLLKDNIPAGTTSQYVLITQVGTDLTSVDSLKLVINKGEDSLTVGLQ